MFNLNCQSLKRYRWCLYPSPHAHVYLLHSQFSFSANMTDGYYSPLDTDVYETVDRVPLPLDVIPPSTLFMPMGGGNEYFKARLKEVSVLLKLSVHVC